MLPKHAMPAEPVRRRTAVGRPAASSSATSTSAWYGGPPTQGAREARDVGLAIVERDIGLIEERAAAPLQDHAADRRPRAARDAVARLRERARPALAAIGVTADHKET